MSENSAKYANALERELACLVACRGISTEALEQGIIGEMVAVLKMFEEAWNTGGIRAEDLPTQMALSKAVNAAAEILARLEPK